MKKILPPKISKYVPYSIFFVVVLSLFSYQHIRISKTQKKLSSLETSQAFFTQNFSEDLFMDNLKIMQAKASEGKVISLLAEIESLKQEQESDSSVADDVYSALEDLDQKIRRNSKAGLDEPNLEELKSDWGEKLLNQDFEEILDSVEEQVLALDSEYDEYLKSLQKTVRAASGYSYHTVSTERGAFNAYVIKVALSSVRVKTVSAASGTCKDNCATKSLAEYVQENGGFAGMNGSYFCPPDYSSCGGKVNSSDFALYDSNEDRWEHKDALGWSETGLITFKGGGASFYKKSTDYGGNSVDAGISNYPSLVKDRNIVVEDDDMTSYQKDVRGPRGVIGVGDENLYLIIVSNATVKDAAYVARALGAKHALNLDGGGSSAMYVNGGYVVGPGRSLPNAVVLIK